MGMAESRVSRNPVKSLPQYENTIAGLAAYESPEHARGLDRRATICAENVTPVTGGSTNGRRSGYPGDAGTTFWTTFVETHSSIPWGRGVGAADGATGTPN